VLLVTSKTRRRWILPKGKVGARLLPSRSAEREAFEEAGVLGRVHHEEVATYWQGGDDPAHPIEPYEVRTFALYVTDELAVWQEMGTRERRWFTLAQAFEVVRDPEIRKALRLFARWINRRDRDGEATS
jgi:8-oxo-dGTP pyrophosphatase MutT (NUDIX family)